jgi:predicted small lipoprotein YifL
MRAIRPPEHLRSLRSYGWFAALAAVLVAALAGCGGGGSSSTPPDPQSRAEARQVAVRWLKEMGAGRIVPACRLMDASNHQALRGHPHWGPAKDCEEHWLHSDNTPLDWKPKRGVISIWGDADPEVLGVHLDGREGAVVVAGAGTKRPVWLTREGGRWLVRSVEYPI